MTAKNPTVWEVKKNSPQLNGEEFLSIIVKVGWADKTVLSTNGLDAALQATPVHYSVWESDTLIGFARVLTDFYLFTTIPEILIDPNHQRKGIGKAIINEIKTDFGNTVIFFGAQAGNEGFFEKMGFNKGMQSYERLFISRQKI